MIPSDQCEYRCRHVPCTHQALSKVQSLALVAVCVLYLTRGGFLVLPHAARCGSEWLHAKGRQSMVWHDEKGRRLDTNAISGLLVGDS